MGGTRVAMADFVAEIRRLCGSGPDPREMERFLAVTHIEPASLDPYVRFEPGRYTRHLVHKDRDVELLVLCGPAAPAHPSTGTRASCAGRGSSGGASASRAIARCPAPRSGWWRSVASSRAGPATSTARLISMRWRTRPSCRRTR